MCISMPKTPAVAAPAERQPFQTPDNGQTDATTDFDTRRRRAMMSTIVTSPQGVLGTPSTTTLGTPSG